MPVSVSAYGIYHLPRIAAALARNPRTPAGTTQPSSPRHHQARAKMPCLWMISTSNPSLPRTLTVSPFPPEVARAASLGIRYPAIIGGGTFLPGR